MQRAENLDLEFDFSDIYSNKPYDPILSLANRTNEEGSVRNEPMLYHIEVLELFIALSKITSFEILQSRLKQVITPRFIRVAFALEDNLTSSTIDNESNFTFEQKLEYDKSCMMSYFKVRLMNLIYIIYFSKNAQIHENYSHYAYEFLALLERENKRMHSIDSNKKLIEENELLRLHTLNVTLESSLKLRFKKWENSLESGKWIT